MSPKYKTAMLRKPLPVAPFRNVTMREDKIRLYAGKGDAVGTWQAANRAFHYKSVAESQRNKSHASYWTRRYEHLLALHRSSISEWPDMSQYDLKPRPDSVAPVKISQAPELENKANKYKKLKSKG